MAELIDKWEVVSKLITLQNNYNFFKNEWDAERLYREIAKLEIGIGKTPGLQVVRCKDCKHMYCCSAIDRMFYCRYPKGLKGMPNIVEENPFCPYGERKDNERKAD